MWYISSGELRGISGRVHLHEAFLDIFDTWVKQVGRFPDLGVLAAASREGFNFNENNTSFVLTEWLLFQSKRIPRMSHEFPTPQEHFLSLFQKIPDLGDALALTSRQDAVLDDDTIDAPNSREDVWDDTIEVPDDYQWPE